MSSVTHAHSSSSQYLSPPLFPSGISEITALPVPFAPEADCHPPPTCDFISPSYMNGYPLPPKKTQSALELGMDWSLREGYAWAEDKEHCEEYGRMLNAGERREESARGRVEPPGVWGRQAIAWGLLLARKSGNTSARIRAHAQQHKRTHTCARTALTTSPLLRTARRAAPVRPPFTPTSELPSSQPKSPASPAPAPLWVHSVGLLWALE